MKVVGREEWTPAEIDFHDGYRDGRDPDTPEPSDNRSNSYRHSFAVGRAEAAGRPIKASVSRRAAMIAEAMDATTVGRVSPGDVVH